MNPRNDGKRNKKKRKKNVFGYKQLIGHNFTFREIIFLYTAYTAHFYNKYYDVDVAPISA